MELESNEIDVLCIGMACWDIAFKVDHHPEENEKTVATQACCGGGGPAANAAVCVSRLGGKSALAATLGQDVSGDSHLAELQSENVDASYVTRVAKSTPVAVSLTKPSGKRSVVNSGETFRLSEYNRSLERLRPRIILVDGHQPYLAEIAIKYYRGLDIQVVLDAGSLHEGTRQLLGLVDHVVASEKFAMSFSASDDPEVGIERLRQVCHSAIITLGERGIIWSGIHGEGWMGAFKSIIVDENGAGDAFHAAFAFGLSKQFEWSELLAFSSAAGTVACEKFGARVSMPYKFEIDRLRSSQATRCGKISEING